MWNGKNKAITFSFDDGVTQDVRLIEILNKYGLKGTFNLNSSLLGIKRDLKCNDRTVSHNKVCPKDVRGIYDGHEVAVHTLSHPKLIEIEDDDTVIYQVEKDRLALSELCGYEVVGMAYPCGGENNDDRVAAIIKNNTGVKYSRTITSNYSFEPQDNLYRFNPSVHYAREDKMFELAERFLSLETDRPQIFYIWGHSYEMDAECISWERFEEFCKMISGKSDIFYGTNKEVIL